MSTDKDLMTSNVRLTDDEAALFSEQLSRFGTSGLPLATGLRAAAEEMPQRRIARAMRSVAKSLDSGNSLEEALASHGKELPEHLRGIVLAGFRTNKTGEVLGRFIEFVHVGKDLRWRLRLNLAQPILALLICFGLFVFLCVTVVESFENIYRDFGVPLPLFTVALIDVSHLFRGVGFRLRDLVVASLFILILMRFSFSQSARRGIIGSIPIMGAVWRNTSLAEFCHLLALMIESSIPLGEAIRLTGKGVQDSAIDRAAQVMSHDVESGSKLSEAMARQPIFPRGLGRVLRWAEGTRGIPESLHMIGEMFEAKARSQAVFTGVLLNVIVMSSILLGISFVVIGLFAPLIMLISRLV